MLLFDLTPDRGASEGHTSHPDNWNIRMELKLSEPLPEPMTCIFPLKYDNSVRVDTSRKVTTNFLVINTTQILFTLKDVRSFLGVFPPICCLAPSRNLARSYSTPILKRREVNLASRSFSTEILERLILRFVRYRNARPRHSGLQSK